MKDSTPEHAEFSRFAKYILSPTILFSLILMIVYVVLSGLVGDFFNPVDAALASLMSGRVSIGASLILLLGQYQDPAPVFPWSLATSMFLHASILHIASNVVFLVFFGFILEEHLTKTRWVITFFLTGLVGNLTFALAGVTGLLGPFPVLGVGASGAVYGIMGTALGVRVAILLIFLAGLDIFAGGGFFAHFGGLITGFIIRFFWIRRPDDL